ncbi:MAG TPA: zeta toxin family protein [Dokdonella sp.]
MPPPSADSPVFLIIAGPNGSGKSSVYANASIEQVGRSVWIINPDLLAARIRLVESTSLDGANLVAVQRIENWLEASLDAHQTVGVETVLSTPKYRRLVERAKLRNFEVYLIYVMLDSPRRNVERVRLRVQKGGHAVPEDKIVDRYTRSLQQLPWFLEKVDRAWIYDNSARTRGSLQKKSTIPSVSTDMRSLLFWKPWASALRSDTHRR